MNATFKVDGGNILRVTNEPPVSGGRISLSLEHQPPFLDLAHPIPPLEILPIGVLKPSVVRAIASAMLSAATEVRENGK